MYQKIKANILLVDYRGYGNSQGVPTEEGLCYDGEAALQYLLSRNDIDPFQIFLFGRSLGKILKFHPFFWAYFLRLGFFGFFFATVCGV